MPSLGEARCHSPTSTSSDDLLQLGILLTLIVLGCLAVFRARQPPDLPPAAPELVDDNQAPEVPTPTSSASSDFHAPRDEDDGLFDHADTQLLVENAHLLGSVIQLQDEVNVVTMKLQRFHVAARDLLERARHVHDMSNAVWVSHHGHCYHLESQCSSLRHLHVRERGPCEACSSTPASVLALIRAFVADFDAVMPS